MARLPFFFLTLLLGLALAQNPQQTLDELFSRYSTGGLSARISGKVAAPVGGVQNIDLMIRAAPGEQIIRVDFLAPGAVADNAFVITPDKAYNYLFVTNQVIESAPEGARVEGLGFRIQNFDNPEDFATEQMSWSENPTPEGGKIVTGTPKPGAAPEDFARLEIELSATGSPVAVRTFAPGDRPTAELKISELQQRELTREELLKFPPDAQRIVR